MLSHLRTTHKPIIDFDDLLSNLLSFDADIDYEVDFEKQFNLQLEKATSQISAAKNTKITNALMKFICGLSQPISILSNPLFINFLNELNPSYKVPCRDYASAKLIPKIVYILF